MTTTEQARAALEKVQAIEHLTLIRGSADPARLAQIRTLAREAAALLAPVGEPSLECEPITPQVLEGVTVAGARAFWALQDLEKRHEALRVAVMVAISDPHAVWQDQREALVAAFNQDTAQPTPQPSAPAAVLPHEQCGVRYYESLVGMVFCGLDRNHAGDHDKGTPASDPAAVLPEPPTHDLKCWPEYFGAVVSGAKRFEIRENDRGFDVGHVVLLREWVPDAGAAGLYTGRTATFRIGYITSWGQKPGTVVFSLEPAVLPEPVDVEAIALETVERLDTEAADWHGGQDSMKALPIVLAALRRVQPQAVRAEMLTERIAAKQSEIEGAGLAQWRYNTVDAIDAARYRRLRVLGVPRTTPGSSLMCFTNLDAFVDADMDRQPSRGEPA